MTKCRLRHRFINVNGGLHEYCIDCGHRQPTQKDFKLAIRNFINSIVEFFTRLLEAIGVFGYKGN